RAARWLARAHGRPYQLLINDDVVVVETTGGDAAAANCEALDASRVDRQRANRAVALNTKPQTVRVRYRNAAKVRAGAVQPRKRRQHDGAIVIPRERVTDVAEGNGCTRDKRRKVQDKGGITRGRRGGRGKVDDGSVTEVGQGRDKEILILHAHGGIVVPRDGQRQSTLRRGEAGAGGRRELFKIERNGRRLRGVAGRAEAIDCRVTFLTGVT